MSLPSIRPSRPLPTYSRTTIARLIASSHRVLIVHSAHVLDLTAFAASHPGGELAILHFVGRDATDEVDAYHSEEVRGRMKGLVVAKVGEVDRDAAAEEEEEEEDANSDAEYEWLPLIPPIALGLIHDPSSPTGWSTPPRPLSLSQTLQLPPTTTTTTTHPTISPSTLEPPPQPLINTHQERQRTAAYRALRGRIAREGLFDPPKPIAWGAGYAMDLMRYAGLGGAAAWVFSR
jgi:delta8-fatty-acid desaturase